MPTVITLAVYFCVADLILIIQCLYYKFLNARKSSLKQSAVPSEVTSESPNQPLLIRRGSDIGLPGSRRPSSASQSRRGSNLMSSSLPAISEEDEFRRSWLRHGVSILLVCVAGAAGWFVAWSTGVWTPTAEDGNDGTVRAVVGAEILGYLSAVCYLGYTDIFYLSVELCSRRVLFKELGYPKLSRTTRNNPAKVFFLSWFHLRIYIFD